MSPLSRPEPRRIAREKATVAAMIALACADRHGSLGGLCPDCLALRDYAHARLDRCPFGARKTTCGQCAIHCYKPDMRARVREVMRYAGPRMLLRHPLMAIQHQCDTLWSRLTPPPVRSPRPKVGPGRAA